MPRALLVGYCVLCRKPASCSECSEPQQQWLDLALLGLQEKVKRMTPEQRAKFKAREERIQTKRAMKQRMVRA